MKFTKTNIEKLNLPERGKRILIWDPELSGFGLRITPSGKMYIVQGRVNGKTRRISIGKHGILTLQEARKKAQKEISKMLDGKDPVVEKNREKVSSLTLRQVVGEYLQKRDLKSTSRSDLERHLARSFALWADRPVIEITRDQVAKHFTDLSAHSPAQANQAFRVLRAVLNYARGAHRVDDKPLIVENPVNVLSDTKVWNWIRPRSGRIPMEKIGTTWNKLLELRMNPANSTVGRTLYDAVSFLLLTGARWSEAAQLTWDRVNLDEGWWYLPDPKNRNPVKFPLSRVAIEILAARPRISKYVFPARSKEGHISDPRNAFHKVSKTAGVHITAHDMRRTFRAIAGECGIELWKAKLLMNHRLNQDVTIGHYTETEDLRYLAQEIDRISSWVTHQGIIAASEKVVFLEGRNRGGAVE
ncbi:MAG: integrase family protein [Syntrophorhabdaceae bacterium]|nr:integrase family protein [Syntrophorhabdaceae bacterium]